MIAKSFTFWNATGTGILSKILFLIMFPATRISRMGTTHVLTTDVTVFEAVPLMYEEIRIFANPWFIPAFTIILRRSIVPIVSFFLTRFRTPWMNIRMT